MAANPTPSPVLRRSTPAIALRLSCGPGRYRRSWSLASADGKSVPAPVLSRTSLLAPSPVSASGPADGGESRASGNADACALFGTSLACRLGSFFSQLIGHFTQFLGHVKAIDHRLAVAQERPARTQV